MELDGSTQAQISTRLGPRMHLELHCLACVQIIASSLVCIADFTEAILLQRKVPARQISLLEASPKDIH